MHEVIEMRLTDNGTQNCSATDLAAFRINAKNPYIPRVWDYFCHPLAFECNADQFGPKPVPTIAEKSECAIEEAATHTDTVSLTVECNEWSDHNIEFTNVDRTSGNRFPKTKVIHRELRLG